MDNPGARIHRKPLPTSIKILGDLIQVRRYEKRLTLRQLAVKMGIANATVRAWEDGTDQPEEQQIEQLMKLLECRLEFAPAVVVESCCSGMEPQRA